MAGQSTSDFAYSRESEIISHFRSLATKSDRSPEEVAEALKDLTNHYERLLDDSKLLTSVGDRLQKKLKGANLMLREQAEEIKRVNATIQEKNVALQESLDALTKAKASRRASALLVIVALVLFLAVEYPEPWIEAFLSGYGGYGIAAIWGIKIFLTMLLLPIQSTLEKVILKQETKRAEADKAAEAKRAAAQAAAEPQPVEPPRAPGGPPRRVGAPPAPRLEVPAEVVSSSAEARP
jgi:hypothetical protein